MNGIVRQAGLVYSSSLNELEKRHSGFAFTEHRELRGREIDYDRDLSKHPIVLNDRFWIFSDGLQYLLQRRNKGKPSGWESVGFFLSGAALQEVLSREAFGVGEVNSDACALLERLPRYRRQSPGHDGADLEAELAQNRYQDKRMKALPDKQVFRGKGLKKRQPMSVLVKEERARLSYRSRQD